VSDDDEVCAECGLATAAGAENCAALRDILFARDFEQPALFARHHRLAVDSYCVQHSAYVESAKSLAAHLCGLCVAIEHGNNAAMLGGIHRWLSTNPSIARPELPVARGELTIVHASGIDDPDGYGVAVSEWARSAWAAYDGLQPLARQWLVMSAGQTR
jgi:hypothetical protein